MVDSGMLKVMGARLCDIAEALMQHDEDLRETSEELKKIGLRLWLMAESSERKYGDE